jgi:ribonuclease D
MKSLKTWRKQKAFEEGIPPYLIATNSQFIHAISENCSSKEQLKLLKGFGQKRIQKYGADILKIIKKGQLNENDQ